jgi:IS5 family transposase
VSQPRDDRQDDLFRASLEAIINLRHPLVRLAAEINWDFLAKRFSSVCRIGPGQPPLPTRLVAGLFIRIPSPSTAFQHRFISESLMRSVVL